MRKPQTSRLNFDIDFLVPKEKLPFNTLDGYVVDALNYHRNGIQQTVDDKAARELINNTVNQSEYEAWIAELFSDIVEKEGIRNDVDFFTPSGNRRSFDALHYEHNLENVVKAMKEKSEKGIGTIVGGNILGASTTEFSSIEEAKQSSDRIRKLPEEEFDKIKDEFNSRFFDLASSLPTNKSFHATDSAAEVLTEAVAKYKTRSGIANYLRRELNGWAKYSETVVDDLIELVNDIRQMPTEYFEAKPRRAVGFDEVGVFVIPNNADVKLKQELLNRGYAIAEYDTDVEGSRQKVVNSFEEYKFSLSDVGEAPVRNGTPLNDLRLDAPMQEDIGPVQEDISQTETTTSTVSKMEQVEDYAPMEDIAPRVTEESSEIPTENTADFDAPIITMKQKLNEKQRNYQKELDKNKQLHDEAIAGYDAKIAKAQAEYDAKKDKTTKTALALARRIERLKRLKGNRDAEFKKAINDIESRMAKNEDQLLRNHDRADRFEKYKQKAEKMFEAEKSILTEEFEKKKATLREQTKDKNAYISNRALELYNELSNLKKGVKASKELGYLLDHGFDWNSLKSTLLKVNRWSSETVNPDSVEESTVREMLNEDFKDKVYELDDIDTEYDEQVEVLKEEFRKKYESFKVANQRMTKQQEYSDQMEELVGDTSTWVDKKMGIFYKINTLRRNLRDIVRDANGNRDIAKADAIYDELQGKYNQHEASLNRESNSIKKPYADMNITKDEDVYIQMLGEFRHNPDTTLTEDVVKDFYEKNKDNIDAAKVDKVIEEARKTYDTLLERVNEVLREQGMKEIPYRQGYFPHFTEEKQGLFAKLINWKTQNNDIPTDIAGLTEQFNPNRSWQSFNKQRTTDATDYSFTKGLDTYVHGALDWIYHIEDIQKRRALENHIRYIHSEQGVKEKIEAIQKNENYDADEMQDQIDLVYKTAGNPLNNFVADLRAGTNRLANKKSSMDRGMEEMTNRKIYSTMTNISNRVNSNLVAGSISSAFTNFIPITQSWGQVSPFSSLRAMGDTIKSIARDDGVVDKSDFLTNRLRKEENLYKTTWDKVGDKLGLLMEGIDNFTSQTVWRSKYLENISKGMSESDAIKNADQFAANVIADRSRGNMPTAFDSKNPLIKVLTAFQLEVNNQYGYMFKDMPQDVGTESKGKLVKGYAAMFIGAYAYNALYSSLTGRNAAFDPISIIKELLEDLFGDDEEEEPIENIMGASLNLADNLLEETPFVGGLLGGGRIPISSALPYDGVYEMLSGTMTDIAEKDWSGLTKEWLNPAYYLAMPMGGGQLKKTIEGLSMFSDDHPVAGSYTNSGDLRFPVDDSFGSKVQAALFGQYASKNARDYFDNDWAPLKESRIQEYIATGLPIAEYRKYSTKLSKIEADHDKNGNAINGSRKKKVINYLNGLDIDYTAKMILFKTQYKSDDTYNRDIVKYLIGREDLSYDEKVTILKELGFEVDAEGNISW